MGPYYNTITIILLYYYTIILLAAWSAVTAFTTTSKRRSSKLCFLSQSVRWKRPNSKLFQLQRGVGHLDCGIASGTLLL